MQALQIARKTNVTFACVMLLAIAGLGAASHVMTAQDISPSELLRPASLTGAWLTTYQVEGFTTSVPVLLTFHEDRTVLESDSPASNPLFHPPAVLSDGQGAWTSLRGSREGTFYYRKLIYEQADSTPAGSTATLGHVTLSANGQSFQATINITFFDKNNQVTNQTSGLVTGTRIVVQN